MNTNLWPYINIARCLSGKKRKGLGNTFRHQVETLAILIEHGYCEPVLLKASVIHDLIEDGENVGFTDFDKIKTLDDDGPEVYKLVEEVSIRVTNNQKEAKSDFLERIMREGSRNARLIKLADRLSNINSLPTTNDNAFLKRYIEETRKHILPYAPSIDKHIALELEKNVSEYNFL
jgi:GTP pyrophosphokinase